MACRATDLGALDPFGNCRFGDRSGDLYAASAALPAVAVTTKRTTVYVTLKRLVRRARAASTAR